MKRIAKHAGSLTAAGLLLASAAVAQAEPVTYEHSIKNIVAAKCGGCHGKNAPTMEEFKKDQAAWTQKMKGPRMDTYPHIMVMVNGSDAGAMMRRLDDGKHGKDGKPGNMHKYLGKDDAERAKNLEAFKQWVGDWNLKRRKDLSQEELGRITAREK